MDLIPISICMCICTCGDAAVCVCRCTCGLPATLDAAAAPEAVPPLRIVPPEIEPPQGLPTESAAAPQTAPRSDVLEVHVGAHVGPYRVLSIPIRNERYLRFDTYSEQLQRSAVMYVYPQDRLPAGSESADRFAEATQALMQLQHPGIARVLDAGKVGARPFLVYEPAGELSLDRLLDCMGALRMQRLAHLGLLAGEALSAAAAAGLSHGELRLDCIGYRRDGSVRILGMGGRGLVARLCPSVAGDAAALPDALPDATPDATPDAWTAPEQPERGSCANEQGDMYSLGAILYAAATGHAPQKAAQRRRARHGSAPSVVQNQLEGYGVPAPIAQVIARYMALEASERYPGWEEATRALQEAVSKSSGALRDVSSQSLLALPAEIEPEEELTFQPERVPASASAPELAPVSGSEPAEPAPSPDEAAESVPPQWLHRVARPLLPLEEERFAAEAEAEAERSAAEDTANTRDERFATDEVFLFRPRRDGLLRRRPFRALRAIAERHEKILYSALFASVIWFVLYLMQKR